MKVRITSDDLGVPIGTVMEVGEAAPFAWNGKYEPVTDGRKRPTPPATTSPVDGGPKPGFVATPIDRDTPAPTTPPARGGD